MKRVLEPRPRIVVVERRDFEHEDVYEDTLESWQGAGYQVVVRTGRAKEEQDYTILEDNEDENE